MANHKSAIKRHRQSLKRRENNRVAKTAVRTEVKKVRAAVEEGNTALAKQLMQQAEKTLAKAAVKGRLHKKNAARRISRLAKLVSKKAAK